MADLDGLLARALADLGGSRRHMGPPPVRALRSVSDQPLRAATGFDPSSDPRKRAWRVSTPSPENQLAIAASSPEASGPITTLEPSRKSTGSMSVGEPGPPTPSEIDANSVSKRVNVNSHSLKRKRTPHRTDEHPYRPRMSARGSSIDSASRARAAHVLKSLCDSSVDPAGSAPARAREPQGLRSTPTVRPPGPTRSTVRRIAESQVGSAFPWRHLPLPLGALFGSQSAAGRRVDALVTVVPADAITRRGIASQHFLNETAAGSAVG